MSTLNPCMTIGTQTREALRLQAHTSRRQTRQATIDALHAVGFPTPERWVSAYPHQLSGGLRQRVVLAQALARKPALVLADEPTTALDVTVQAHILAVLSETSQQQGTSVLLITHDLTVVASVAQRIVVMYAGRLAEDSPTADLLRAPVREGASRSPSVGLTARLRPAVHDPRRRSTPDATPVQLCFPSALPHRASRLLRACPPIPFAANRRVACVLPENEPENG